MNISILFCFCLRIIPPVNLINTSKQIQTHNFLKKAGFSILGQPVNIRKDKVLSNRVIKLLR
jgi:hypothetical protein